MPIFTVIIFVVSVILYNFASRKQEHSGTDELPEKTDLMQIALSRVSPCNNSLEVSKLGHLISVPFKRLTRLLLAYLYCVSIIDKYVEMNVAHPFMEGNGRSTRIWLNMMLKHLLKLCVDWSQIDKTQYMEAMVKSVSNSSSIKNFIKSALTDRINDREMFMKGID